MSHDPVRRLKALGQSVWLDNLDRGMIRDGRLKRWIDDGIITGITSNPPTFRKAIGMEAKTRGWLRWPAFS